MSATPRETTADEHDPKLALKIAFDDYAGQLYEATRALWDTTHTIAGATPSEIAPWAALDERQRRSFIRAIQDTVPDLTAATTATGSRA